MKWCFCALLLVQAALAQPVFYSLENHRQAAWQAKAPQQFHTALKPLSVWIDTAAKPTGGADLMVVPLPPGSIGMESARGFRYTGTFGARIQALVGSRWAFNAWAFTALARPFRQSSDFASAYGSLPGLARRFGTDSLSRFDQCNLHLAFKASKWIRLFAGRGKHFIGEGYRSVLLSDFAPATNYGRAEATVWKLNYTVLYQQAINLKLSSLSRSTKYITSHYLSVALTPWWQVGAFEAVVWEAEDSAQQRGFEVQYLNPVTFYRPLEYAMGSSDNALLGFSSTIKTKGGLCLYGQAMLDEFIMTEFLAPAFKRLVDETTPTGSWVNKQAYQAGARYAKGSITALAEVNVVRPFTFSHSNASQAYTNLGQPLAHPLGANLVEWVAGCWWRRGKWSTEVLATYARQGEGATVGSDPRLSNHFMLNSFNYNQRMLQGAITDRANVRLEGSYLLIERFDWRLRFGVQQRLVRQGAVSTHSTMLQIGIDAGLWREQREF